MLLIFFILLFFQSIVMFIDTRPDNNLKTAKQNMVNHASSFKSIVDTVDNTGPVQDTPNSILSDLSRNTRQHSIITEFSEPTADHEQLQDINVQTSLNTNQDMELDKLISNLDRVLVDYRKTIKSNNRVEYDKSRDASMIFKLQDHFISWILVVFYSCNNEFKSTTFPQICEILKQSNLPITHGVTFFGKFIIHAEDIQNQIHPMNNFKLNLKVDKNTIMISPSTNQFDSLLLYFPVCFDVMKKQTVFENGETPSSWFRPQKK